MSPYSTTQGFVCSEATTDDCYGTHGETLFAALHEDKLPSIKQRVYRLHGILGALVFLHIKGIVHQDVKAPNTLLNEDLTVAKLCDFGEAREKGFNTTQGMANSVRTGGATTAGTAGCAATSRSFCQGGYRSLHQN